jgi:hypothetical protein
MRDLDVNAFTVAVEWFLQRQAINCDVSVYMGDVHKARGFDVIHDDREARFIIDEQYVENPKETIEMLKKLHAWIKTWNDMEMAKRINYQQPFN